MTTFPYVKDYGNRLSKKLKVDMIMELGNNVLGKVDKELKKMSESQTKAGTQEFKCLNEILSPVSHVCHMSHAE